MSKAIADDTRPSATKTSNAPEWRWNDVAKELISVQDHCRQWLDALPHSLHGTSLHEKRAAIDALDLEALTEIDFPRGFGRD